MLRLYSSDVGILTSQLMRDVDVRILNVKSAINYGSIFENAAAQKLTASGHSPLHYYQTAKTGEVDFVLQEQGSVVICEIKTGKDYRHRSALPNLLSLPNYGIERAFALCEDNVSVEGKVTYLPVYMLGLAWGKPTGPFEQRDR